MTSFHKVLAFIFLLAFTLTNLDPTCGQPTRSPSSRDDRLRKEIDHSDSRSRKEPYRREPHRSVDRPRKELYPKDDRKRKYESFRKNEDEPQYQKSQKSYRSTRSESSRWKYHSDKDSRTFRSQKPSVESVERQQLLKEEASRIRRNSRKDIKTSKEEIKRLTKEFNQFHDARLAADRAEIRVGNTVRDAWAGKYIELETAKSNIRRHERAGNYLHHTPAVSQALHEQADKLKAGPERLEAEMADLKSKGKHDEGLEWIHNYKHIQEHNEFLDKVNRHAGSIFMDKQLLRKYKKY
ncbi:uncharacterized protein FA14DRAFT_40677 [Meira miltonrushii]|uniref:Pre-mRNA-splicing factor SYF2 n=1 Tax=Meira miltonrushii TaxID=1280837 RepID=A0A316VCT7_9BASI|nr:uncharacterized protein FA14DRAFT_40677 [Meira miltonrushii]PWN35372.1 hypothetical protein FA14DRAFT_40677 [Meira miltonrushii]